QPQLGSQEEQVLTAGLITTFLGFAGSEVYQLRLVTRQSFDRSQLIGFLFRKYREGTAPALVTSS
ncbi:hypothetical protein, partial [Cognatishimia sp.]|uniref:hypothetical protein n=1 Tax=Cognatishimia sp. TaxID=2211648 RepID=UPI003511DA5C